MTDVTRILSAIEQGEVKATDDLLPLVYEELRILAAQRLSQEQAGQTLQATALVHEAYIRLVGNAPQTWNSRGHFFAAAAEAMRRIILDRVRHKKRIKRGGAFKRRDLNADDVNIEDPSDDLLALDEALEKLAKRDPVKANLVKLRFFAGLSNAQAAKALGLSHNTVDRYWAYARSWLHLEISKGDERESEENSS